MVFFLLHLVTHTTHKTLLLGVVTKAFTAFCIVYIAFSKGKEREEDRISGRLREGNSGGSRNFGRGGGRQCISPVVIYRKCTRYNKLYAFYTGKGDLLENIKRGQ